MIWSKFSVRELPRPTARGASAPSSERGRVFVCTRAIQTRFDVQNCDFQPQKHAERILFFCKLFVCTVLCGISRNVVVNNLQKHHVHNKWLLLLLNYKRIQRVVVHVVFL